MRKLPISILILVTLFSFNKALSQDVNFEKVKSLCDKDIPREEKIRITVVDFSSKVRAKSGALGSELATMLTNALYEVNCFRVLESADKTSVFEKEYELGNSGYTNSNSSKKGNMLGAQVIVTGEITEYGEGAKNVNVAGIKVGSTKAHVGFILKVLDPETREVLYSKSVDMEGRANGFNGLSVGRINIGGKTDRSKALNDAVEKAIIKAAEHLAKDKDQWDIVVNSGIGDRNVKSNPISVMIHNVDYASLIKIQKQLQTIDGVKSVEKQLANGVGHYTTDFVGSVDDLAMAIAESVGAEFEITNVTAHEGITLRKK